MNKYNFKNNVLFLFSCSVVSDCLWPHELQYARLPCPSPSPRACSNSCPLSGWCHPTISSSVVPFSSCPESFTASGSFLMCWLFASGGQSIGASASASVLPMNIQDWFPLGLTGWISGCWNSHFHFNYHFSLYTSLFLLFMPFCVRTHLFPSLSAHP